MSKIISLDNRPTCETCQYLKMHDLHDTDTMFCHANPPVLVYQSREKHPPYIWDRPITHPNDLACRFYQEG